MCERAASARALQESCLSLMQNFRGAAFLFANTEIPNIIEYIEDEVSPFFFLYLE